MEDIRIDNDVTSLNLLKSKSCLIIGEKQGTKIFVDTKFNKFQKFMWKFLLNIKIEDVE